MRRPLFSSLAFIVGMCFVMPGRSPSVEEMFAATTAAADETEGAMCLMPAGHDGPDGIDGRDDSDRPEQAPIVIPKSSNVEGEVQP